MCEVGKDIQSRLPVGVGLSSLEQLRIGILL